MKYVLYHGSCYDGFGAAYAAWLSMTDSAKYIPVSYGAPPPKMPDAKIIFIVDFSYPKEILMKMAETAQVTVIDHHKTAKEDLIDLLDSFNPRVIFDMEKSGALLTWNYFYGSITPPKLLEHISDRDLWQFRLEGTAQVHKALVSYPMDFELWYELSKDLPKLIVEGTVCERMYSQLVENICANAWIGLLDGHQVPIVNTSIAWSEVGNALLEKYPAASFAVSFTVLPGQIMWSLRSKDEFDVSEIARKFGGGGHKNAAGFKSTGFPMGTFLE